jgi:DNA polymerase-4
MADAVATRLRAGQLTGRTVTLKVRYGDFSTITRSQTVGDAIDTATAIAGIGVSLLRQVDVSAGVRLLGVSVTNLAHGSARQLTLDLAGQPGPETGKTEPRPASWEGATVAIDRVRARFGDRAVGPAVLLDPDGLRIKRQGDTQWGPGEEDGPHGGDGPGPR